MDALVCCRIAFGMGKMLKYFRFCTFNRLSWTIGSERLCAYAVIDCGMCSSEKVHQIYELSVQNAIFLNWANICGKSFNTWRFFSSIWHCANVIEVYSMSHLVCHSFYLCFNLFFLHSFICVYFWKITVFQMKKPRQKSHVSPMRIQ